MNILSDHEIRQRLVRGELVENGVESDAKGCSYSFKSGRIFPAGGDRQPVNWDEACSAFEEYIANPGEMFWVRTHLKIKLPYDVCAFWWQTNTLSRDGILLLNMTIVDPGYEGWLACLFVNFGNRKIVIGHNTTIARLVFVQLDTPVSFPFKDGQPLGRYDEDIRVRAVNAPASFLQINEQAAHVSKQLESFGRNFEGLLEKKVELAARDTSDKFKENLSGAIKSIFWTRGWVFLVAALAWNAINWAFDKIRPNRQEQLQTEAALMFLKSNDDVIRRAVDEAIRVKLGQPSLMTTNPISVAPKRP